MTTSSALIWTHVDTMNLVTGSIKKKNACTDSDKARLIIMNM